MILKIETVYGREGNSLSICNEDEKGCGTGRRIAGPKPWGGGRVIDGFEIYPDEIKNILDEIYRVYPDQTISACKEIIEKEWGEG